MPFSLVRVKSSTSPKESFIQSVASTSSHFAANLATGPLRELSASSSVSSEYVAKLKVERAR